MAEKKSNSTEAAENVTPVEVDETPAVDEKKEKRIRAFLNEYGAPESRANAMRKAFESGVSVDDFAKQFLQKSLQGTVVGRAFVNRVKEVIG